MVAAAGSAAREAGRPARIAVLPGDGVGPEVIAQAKLVLRAVARHGDCELTLIEAPIGGAALESAGDPLPSETLAVCKGADAVLLGAVGGPRWDGVEPAKRPESGLLRLRRELQTFANLRPVKAYEALLRGTPLRAEVARGTDLVFVRELLGGIYYGPKREGGGEAEDVCRYEVDEIRRVTRLAARLARARRGKLTSIDKANVLATSRLWRRTVAEVVAAEFPEVDLEHVLVDACAMHLMRRPRDFDVLLTENLFGDILSDEASVLAGSLGMLPSASLGDAGSPGLYEPVHGSAPDIAGRGIANPLGAILSAALLLRHSLGMEAEAAAVEGAVERVVGSGPLTPDCVGDRLATTAEVGEAVLLGVELALAVCIPRPQLGGPAT
jgi:3-isopropylmalate dehydrogenase